MEIPIHKYNISTDEIEEYITYMHMNRFIYNSVEQIFDTIYPLVIQSIQRKSKKNIIDDDVNLHNEITTLLLYRSLFQKTTNPTTQSIIIGHIIRIILRHHCNISFCPYNDIGEQAFLESCDPNVLVYSYLHLNKVFSSHLEFTKLFQYANYGNYAEVFTYVNVKHQLVFAFRSTKHVGEWIRDFNIQLVFISDIYQSNPDLFPDIGFIGKSKIHAGFHSALVKPSSFVKEESDSDYTQYNSEIIGGNTLLEFIIRVFTEFKKIAYLSDSSPLLFTDKSHKPLDIVFVGHSKGGALATLCSAYLHDYLYHSSNSEQLGEYLHNKTNCKTKQIYRIFVMKSGCPIIGNKHYVTYYESKIRAKDIRYRSLINTGDIVASSNTRFMLSYRPLYGEIILSHKTPLVIDLQYDPNYRYILPVTAIGNTMKSIIHSIGRNVLFCYKGILLDEHTTIRYLFFLSQYLLKMKTEDTFFYYK